MPNSEELARLEELDRLDKLDKQAAQEPSLLKQLGHGALKALDYTSGIGRTAGAVAAGDVWDMANAIGLTDKGSPMTVEQRNNAAEQAFQGAAPTTSEYLDMYGMKPGLPRTALGFVGDVALDPANYVPALNIASWAGKGMKAASAGTKAVTAGIPYAGKAVEYGTKPIDLVANLLDHGASKTVDAGGENLYKSAFHKIDEQAARNRDLSWKAAKGTTDYLAPSDVFLKNRATGTAASLRDAQHEISQALLSEREGLLNRATDAGARIDYSEALAPLQKDLRNVSSNLPLKKQAAQEYQDILAPYMDIANREAGKATPIYDFSAHAAKPNPTAARGAEIVIDNAPVVRPNTMPRQYRDVGPHYGEAPRFGESVVDDSLLGQRAGAYPGTPGRVGATPLETGENITHINSALADRAYKDTGKSSIFEGFAKQQAKLLRQAQEASTLGHEIGGRTLKDMNSEMSALLAGSDAVTQGATSEAGKNLFTSVDGMLLSNPQILAAKKIADTLKTPWFRTKVGLGMQDLATNPVGAEIIDNIAKRSIWSGMTPNTQKERAK
jgi:hypothetical protein